jgi:site-specific DNA recombinase
LAINGSIKAISPDYTARINPDRSAVNKYIIPIKQERRFFMAMVKEITSEKPVGIWIRVSTEDQARGESPEHHEKRARYYAESKGWLVKEVYHLEAVSGKSVMEHPETQRMLEDIKFGHITGLIFSKLARLARNTKELLDFSDIFRNYNADLISLQESIDTSTPAGRLFYTVVAAMAQWEREEIADRVAASVPIRAKLGKPLGGQGSFGYVWKDGKLIPHPTEAPVRKLIYELFFEHKRKKTVARILNEKGYRTRKGAKFSDTTIERLLRDPVAKGVRRANYTKSLGVDKKWALKPKSEWVLTEVEPIVSEELWEQCNQILDEQKKNHKPPARKAVHLFTGIAFCHCGNKMYVPSSSPKYTCHKCHNKISTRDLEEIYHQQLKNFFFSPDEIANYLNEADKVIKGKQELLDSLQGREQKIQREADKVYRTYIDDEEMTSKTFGQKYRPLEEQLEQIQSQIPQVQAEIDFLRIQYLSSDQILNEARDLYSRWPMLTFEEKIKIIENITDKIIVGKDDITINLCYLPTISPSENLATWQRNLRDSWRRLT